jgi:hypothetical protein
MEKHYLQLDRKMCEKKLLKKVTDSWNPNMPEKVSWSSEEGTNKIQSFKSCKIVEEQFTLLFDQVDVEKTIIFF